MDMLLLGQAPIWGSLGDGAGDGGGGSSTAPWPPQCSSSSLVVEGSSEPAVQTQVQHQHYQLLQHRELKSLLDEDNFLSADDTLRRIQAGCCLEVAELLHVTW